MFYEIAQKISKNLQSESIPTEAVFLTICAFWSFIASFKRVYAQEKRHESGVLASVYALILAPSGFGKNYVVNEVKRVCFEKCIKEIEEFYKEKYETQLEKIKKDADDKFIIQNEQKENSFFSQNKSSIDYKSRDRFLEAHAPSRIKPIISDATKSAYQDQRAELSESYFQENGGLMFVHTELEQFIIAQNFSKSDFMIYLGDIWDGREIGSKILKGEKSTNKTVKEIPNTVLGFTTHDRDSNALQKLMQLSFSRRAFIYFVDAHINIKNGSFEHVKKEYEKNYITDCEPLDFNDLFLQKFHNLNSIKEKLVFSMDFSKEKNNVFEKYINMRAETNEKLKTLQNGSLEYLSENGKHFKIFKLACLMQAFINPNESFISDNAFNEALKACTISDQSAKLFTEKNISNHFQDMFDFFMKNLGKILTNQELRKKNIFSHKTFKRDMQDFIEYAQEIAELTGYSFQILKSAKNATFYVLKPLKDILNV